MSQRTIFFSDMGGTPLHQTAESRSVFTSVNWNSKNDDNMQYSDLDDTRELVLFQN